MTTKLNRRQFLFLGKRPPPANGAKSAPLAKQSNPVQRNANLNAEQLASRLLAQATLGGTMADINTVTSMGIENWINDQLTKPQSQILDYMWNVINPVYTLEDYPLLSTPPFRWAWWQAVMTGNDQLRQRVAMALSEIMVISTRTDILEDASTAVGSYYDMLLKHGFGNFRDLLFDVTMHPAMGYYLSHASNRKSDTATNRFPDENFAREVMQLFSIGLFELNLDGSRQLDSNGDPIPTYDNSHITEFAKIFTGLTYAVSETWEEQEIDITTEAGFVAAELTYDNGSLPMEMHDIYHEQGQKILLNGYTVPNGQTGMQDINNAVDHLFNHPNVAPFISRLLIQRLVKSHPSPAYIARVATQFNNNGSGVRGDMKAVVKAILMDDEARNPSFINDPTHGMLREPFVRYTQLARAFEAFNENGENLFYNYAEFSAEQLGQYPFASPSVFNFFSPDFKPLGVLADAGISAPEFQITTSVSAIKTMNYWEEAIFEGALMEMPDGGDPPVEVTPVVSEVLLNFDPYFDMEGDVAAVVNRLDLLLTYGSMSSQMRQIITTAITTHANTDWEQAVMLGILLVMDCPEYAILK